MTMLEFYELRALRKFSKTILHEDPIWSAATFVSCCVMVLSNDSEKKSEYEGVGTMKGFHISIANNC